MAAPSRSINYRSGAPIQFEDAVFKSILDSIRDLPKEANKRLRAEAGDIAEEIVKPAVIGSILSHAGPVGPKLAQSVRVRGDRVPSVIIGRSRGPYYSGHPGRRRSGTYGPDTAKQSMRRTGNQASTNMLRYGTIVGVYRRAAGSSDISGRFRSRGEEVMWPKNIVTPGWPTAAATKFYPATMLAWETSVTKIVTDFNKGVI